jgi:hypothetical protein
MFRKLVSSLVISLAVMGRSDAVGVRGKIVELGGSLVPIASALPALVAHVTLLYEMKLDYTTLMFGPISGPIFGTCSALRYDFAP